MANKRGRKPVKFPKTNVVTFRLSDPEFHVLRFYAQHCARSDESFSDTLARICRDAIIEGAVRQLEFVRNVTNPTLSITRDACRHDILKAGSVVRRSVEDGKPQPREYPTLGGEALHSALGRSVSLASPSVVVVAVPGFKGRRPLARLARLEVVRPRPPARVKTPRRNNIF